MNLRKVAGLVLLEMGVCPVMAASPAPEIDPALGLSALALAPGALLPIRGRRL